MFALALADMFSRIGERIEAGLGFSFSSVTAANRNLICREALRREVDYVLFIDNDMQFPAYSLARLLKFASERDLDILGCNYLQRQYPHKHTVTGIGVGDERGESRVAGIVEVARLPAGMLLVNARVIRKVAPPWFYSVKTDEEAGVSTEDYPFCDAARAAGFRLWMDTDLSLELVHWTGDIGVRWNSDGGYDLISLSGKVYER